MLAMTIVVAQPTPLFEDVLAGNWSGTLEYRDYRSDRRVTLPTKLLVESGGQGQLTVAYTYQRHEH